MTGFGSFELREAAVTQVRTISGAQKGQIITVPAHRRVGFSAGAELNKAVR